MAISHPALISAIHLMLGEFKLAPAGVGADVFTEKWDELLGEMWNAATALALDGG